MSVEFTLTIEEASVVMAKDFGGVKITDHMQGLLDRVQARAIKANLPPETVIAQAALTDGVLLNCSFDEKLFEKLS